MSGRTWIEALGTGGALTMSWHMLAFQWLAQGAAGGLLVLLAGSLAAKVCRQPVRRARLALLTMAGGLIVPWLAALSVAPAWTSVRIPAPAPAPARAEARPAAARVARTPAPDAIAVPTVARTEPGGPGIEATVVAAATRSEPGVRAEAVRPARVRGVSWQVALPAAYASASAGLIGWWLFGQFLLGRVVRSARPAPGWVRALFLGISGEGGGRVVLLSSDRIALPLTYTWTRPVILLPESLCDGSDVGALRYGLAHEWSHVERRDSFAWTLASLAGFALFYQPLFWWLRRQLRLCQDYLADDRAAAHGSAEDYAAYLVRLARMRKVDRGRALPALSVGDCKSNLYRRVVMLVQDREPLEHRCRALWTAGVGAAAALAVLAASGLRLDAAPQEGPALKQPKADAPKADADKTGETLHYTGKVKEKGTGKPIAGANVTVRRTVLPDPKTGNDRVVEETKHTTDADGAYAFTIPPEQSADPRMYIELDVDHPDYATQAGFGYALAMIRKNEKLGERPFFESIELRPAEPILGRVETPGGAPAAGVEILAFSKSGRNKPGEPFEYGSFSRAKTDADGKFRVPVTTPGLAVFWILPKDYAPEMHAVPEGKRGDFGSFVLAKGVKIRGRAFDAEGKPIAGLFVQAERDRGAETEALNELAVSDAIERSAETDADGRFAFDPLPAGKFTVKPIDYKIAQNPRSVIRRPLTAVFLPQSLTLIEGETPEPLEVRASPHVVIDGQWLDSQGKPKGGWDCFVNGRLDGKPWHTQGYPDANGKFSVKVPHGLEDAQVDLMTNEHHALRHRLGKDGTLSPSRQRMLGTLDHDVKDLQIIRYVAPTVVVKATAKDGTPVKDFEIGGKYEEETDGPLMQFVVKGGLESNISFNKQEDGRQRTSQLTPDRAIKITVSADGFQPSSRTFKLPEGKTEDATFVLEPK